MAREFRCARSILRSASPVPSKRVQQDVIGLERGVGFELAAPVAVFVLAGENDRRARRWRRRRRLTCSVNFAEERLPDLHLPERLEMCEAFAMFSFSTVAAGAEAMACTISGGNPKRTFSGMTSTSSTLVKPLSRGTRSTSFTRTSGADAPAVRATVVDAFEPLRLDVIGQLSIRYEERPRFRATSTRRFEFELLSEPTTSSRSASLSNVLHRGLTILRGIADVLRVRLHEYSGNFFFSASMMCLASSRLSVVCVI